MSPVIGVEWHRAQTNEVNLLAVRAKSNLPVGSRWQHHTYSFDLSHSVRSKCMDGTYSAELTFEGLVVTAGRLHIKAAIA